MKPLLWLVGLVPLIWAVRRGLVDRPRAYKAASLGLRVLSISLLILAVCRPFWTSLSRDLHVVFLVDVSESVDLKDARKAVDLIDQCIDRLNPSDAWSILLVGKGVFPMQDTHQAASELDRWIENPLGATDLPDPDFRSASHLADALLTARMCFPAIKARRIVLFTDGRPTESEDMDLRQATETLAAEGIDLRWHALAGLRQAEACIESLQPSTTQAYKGERVRMRVKVRANQATKAQVRLLNKAVVAGQADILLEPDKDQTVDIDVSMIASGPTRWTAELIAEQDHFTINNQTACTVTVQGQPRILVLHETPGRMRPFTQALQEQGFEIDVRGSHGMPADLAALLAFDAVILADVPATDLSLDQMRLLKRYVIDLGGGVAMFGSNHSFGLGGYYRTPVEEVLPLTSRYEKEKEQPSVAMVLVIDKSGSMNGMPIELARQAAKSSVDLLGRQDQIGVVGFDGQAYVICPMQSVTGAQSIKGAINALDAGGGTYMYPGLKQAFDMLDQTYAKIKHVIVLSDGQSQPADHEGLVTTMVGAGITVSTIALGDANRDLLARLADIGRGRYYETVDPANIPQIFTKETVETSGTAIKEDVFNLIRTSDHTLLSGFTGEDLPVVFGYVMTQVKPATQLLLVAHTGDPVMAVARYGLGMSLAYTSDVTDQWGAQWLQWDRFGRFWAQALRSLLRKATSDGLFIQQTAAPDRWTIRIQRQDDQGRPLSGIRFEAQTVEALETEQHLPVEEIGLGQYQIVVPVQDTETLTLHLHDPEHDKTATLHYNRPYPEEYKLTAQTDPTLESCPRLAPDAIHQDLLPVKVRRPISHVCYLLALAAMLAGLAFRRI
ncbi:MAG: VWA domain-containing protein [Phycisphaerae bacterium]|nr:VWA domain-containing protein [Phycisphaerae bacterium]